jgi:hypothetical protein
MHEDAGAFLSPEGQVVALDDEFHGIAHGRELLDPQPGPPDEPHFQQPLADLPLCVNLNNLSFISGLEET